MNKRQTEEACNAKKQRSISPAPLSKLELETLPANCAQFVPLISEFVLNPFKSYKGGSVLLSPPFGIER